MNTRQLILWGVSGLPMSIFLFGDGLDERLRALCAGLFLGMNFSLLLWQGFEPPPEKKVEPNNIIHP